MEFMLLSAVAAMGMKEMSLLMSVLVVSMLRCVPYMSSVHSSNIFYHTYWCSMDGFSAMLVMLSMWMTILMCLAMWNASEKGKLMLCFSGLKLILVLSFMSKSLFGFFMFFELSLMPTLYIILGWGMQPERMQAGSYLMIYTIVGALPLLGVLVYTKYCCGNVKIFMPRPHSLLFFSKMDYSLLCTFFMLAFLMKLPIYGVHLWLPKAHVEAPVAGSMVLAGMLLKLGAYGLVRSLSFMELDLSFWSELLFLWAMFTMCMVGLMCFRQCDLKSLVAYSSVAHMSLVLGGCFSFDVMGMKGMTCMLVSHGLCSSGLFFGVQCLYEKSGSRKMLINRGWMSICPTFTFFWFLLCVGKASAPPSLNLLSEFLLMSSIVSFGGWMAAGFCGLSVFLGGLFSIYLYVSVCHGKWSKSSNFWWCMSPREMLVLFLHVVPLYGLMFLSKYMFS